MSEGIAQKPLIANKQATTVVGSPIGDQRMRANQRGGRAAASDRPAVSDDKLAKARAAFSAQWNQASIPRILNDDDWHYCWLSTTNSYDPIHQRMALGYEPVRPEDVAGNLSFTSPPMSSGEFAGCVSVKEMVLFRIPREIYQVAMEEMHFNEPNRLEQSVKEMFDEAANLAGRSGRSLGRDVGDGVHALGSEHSQAPIFD